MGSDAQGQPAPAETGTTQQVTQSNQQTEGQVPAGLQARIDELTAKRYAAERQAQDMVAQNQILLQQLMEANRPQVQAQPAVDVDPELRKQLEAVMGPQLAELRRFQVQNAHQLALQQVNAEAPNAEVAKEATRIISEERRKGNEIPADVAVTYALGLLARKQLNTSQTAQQQRTGYNQGAASTITSTGAGPNLTPSNTRPADFDRWPADQQVKYLGERGVGDLPL